MKPGDDTLIHGSERDRRVVAVEGLDIRPPGLPLRGVGHLHDVADVQIELLCHVRQLLGGIVPQQLVLARLADLCPNDVGGVDVCGLGALLRDIAPLVIVPLPRLVRHEDVHARVVIDALVEVIAELPVVHEVCQPRNEALLVGEGELVAVAALGSQPLVDVVPVQALAVVLLLRPEAGRERRRASEGGREGGARGGEPHLAG
mmetsp:Transcript_1330/g.4484  ORF Transcript_1330/g.4484 Transcript_1330/m.4484 type:complete len:203 (+) Transcript_1330:271-879(+)